MVNQNIQQKSPESNEEEWRPIPGCMGYEVSNLGGIRSYRGVGRYSTKVSNSPHPLKPVTYGRYLAVFVSPLSGTPHKKRHVHRLVLEAFVGPRPFPRAEARHLNGVKTDNRAKNLAWGTHRENGRDAIRLGEMRGSRNGSAKLSEADVLAIRQFLAEGLSQAKIGVLFGVGQSCISWIARGEHWKHVR